MPGPRRISRRSLFGIALSALGPAGCESERDARRTAALWFSYGGKNRESLERLIQRFNASSQHRIHGVFQGDYYEGLAKLRLAIAARAAPSTSHVIGEAVPYLADARALEPLDGLEGAAALDVLDALGQTGSYIGGGERPLVALPFNRSTPIAYLNQELFDAAHLSAPRTWRELRETARALTVRGSGRTLRYGFECPLGFWFWLAMVHQAGGELVDERGNLTLGGEAGVRALELWQTLVNVDRTMKPPPGRDAHANESTNTDFLSRRAAMIWNSTAFLKYFEETARFAFSTAPLPKDVRAGVPTGGTHFVLLRSAPDELKEVGWSFLRFMLEPAQVVDWCLATGYLPTTLGAVRKLEQDRFYERHPNYRVAYDQLAVARPAPWSARLLTVQREVVQPCLERAVLHRISARQALAEAERALARYGQ
jgi:sn-glycerol 3-phosphate transport system substrate-binding protein